MRALGLLVSLGNDRTCDGHAGKPRSLAHTRQSTQNTRLDAWLYCGLDDEDAAMDEGGEKACYMSSSLGVTLTLGSLYRARDDVFSGVQFLQLKPRRGGVWRRIP
jgi:hypothetical protein